MAAVELTESAALQRRLGSVVEAYDSQGFHRSGTEVDHRSAEWLVAAVRDLGLKAALEPFVFDRVDPNPSFLLVAGRRIEGMPLFDAAFTGQDGVRGHLGSLGSDAEIAVAETEPFALMDPQKEQRDTVVAARRSAHRAAVLLTRGSKPGLFLLNALSFRKPCGPPMLQVSSEESDWLRQQTAKRAEATVIAAAARTATRAFNVTATIPGRDPSQPPLVIMTPRSGWWQCASERGGGLACWLETMRTLANAAPVRDCLFVACSGHELGFLGIDAYLERRPGLCKDAHAWIHFGANIGAPSQGHLLHSSDDEIEGYAVTFLDREGLSKGATAARQSNPRGEAGALHRGGARYIALVCGTEVFHHASDRWPDAVDVAQLRRYASAFANAAFELASCIR